MSKPTINSLEQQAEWFWQIMLDSGLSDGHCKSYDPLTIEQNGNSYTFLSYIFDFSDGSRSRSFRSLADGQTWLLRSFKQWLSDDRLKELQAESEVTSKPSTERKTSKKARG